MFALDIVLYRLKELDQVSWQYSWLSVYVCVCLPHDAYIISSLPVADIVQREQKTMIHPGTSSSVAKKDPSLSAY